MYSDFRMWLHEITGFTDLTDQVDMSCSKYQHTGEYCKILIINPGLIICSKGFFAGLIFGVVYY